MIRYAITTQATAVRWVLKDWMIVGSEMFTMLASSVDIKTPMEMLSVTHRL
jgi:hypothetical protein